MASSAADLANKFGRLATAVERGKRESVFDASLVVKDEFTAGARRAGVTGSTRVKGSPITAGFSLRGEDALVKYRGPFHLIDNPTKPHTLLPRGRTRRRGSKRALRIAPGVVRASANHPGTRGKRTFPKTRERSGEAARKVLQSGLRTNIIKAGFGR